MEHENDPPAPPLSSCLGLAAPLWTWQPLLADTRGADGHHHHEQDQGDGDEAQLRNGFHEQDENDLEIRSSRLNLPKHQKYQQIYTTAITIGMNEEVHPNHHQVSSVSTVSTTTGGIGGEAREPWRWLQWARKPQTQVFGIFFRGYCYLIPNNN